MIEIGKTDTNNNKVTAGGIGCIFMDERKTKLYLFRVNRHQMQLEIWTEKYTINNQYSTGILYIMIKFRCNCSFIGTRNKNTIIYIFYCIVKFQIVKYYYKNVI